MYSKNSILNAPYHGFHNLNAPTFGDIAVLAKGKLKKNEDQTFSFEQINERCDEQCQINADKYLENVTALWMVERIRHRDDTGMSHRYDLKFTIVPIYYDQRHQVDHNILENRLKNHMKRTFILRDSDYPNYFQPTPNRRTDLFSPGVERSLSNFMGISPNSLMSNILGYNQPPQKQKHQPKDARLNTGEFYMSPKISSSAKTHFHPTVSHHAAGVPHDHRVRFPDSREMTLKRPPMNLYRPKPEIYAQKSVVDYRGANDNVFVGSSDHQLTQPSNHLPQPNHQPLQLPVFSYPVEMPLIQYAQSPYAFPFQIQLSTPANQPLYPQPDVTTFRYQPHQLIGLSNHPSTQLFKQYVPYNVIPQNVPKFQESERHTMNYYSPPDPVYHHQQSTTEAPIQPSTYSPRFNNYASIVRPQIETPTLSTASSIQVNNYNDNEFQPMTPSYDVRKLNQFKNIPKGSSAEKPNSINAQLLDTYVVNENITISSYATPVPAKETNDVSDVSNYDIVVGRPKSTAQKNHDKPVLKWLPKKQRNKLADATSTTTSAPSQATISPSSFYPTILPSAATTQASTRLTTHIFRGRNRFNKRNSTSSASARGATISPQSTTKIVRKKTTSALPITRTTTQTPLTETSIFPTYITSAQSTDEPVTLQSLSTSISLEVNGERVYDPTTTAGYELVSAGVESIATNSSNVKLFKASVVPEKFDDLTVSILNHAKAIESDKREH